MLAYHLLYVNKNLNNIPLTEYSKIYKKTDAANSSGG